MFAPLWTGCKCGETWHVAFYEECDTEHDEIYQMPYCTICNSTAITPKIINEVQCMHPLTEEEMDAELFDPGLPFDDEDDWHEEWDFDPVPEYLADERKCRECGCTDNIPCIDPETGEYCSWHTDDLCTFCANKLGLEDDLPF